MYARKIDHIVLYSDDLKASRIRLNQLGFETAPLGIHPFGTENINVYFKNGLMFETVGVGHVENYKSAINDGNAFVKNDAVCRQRSNNSGFSHVVATSENVPEDHQRFCRSEISGGPVLNFRRDFVSAEGVRKEVAFRLAFATHPDAPTACFFSCEDLISPESDLSDLISHENGAYGIQQVVSCSLTPKKFQGVFETIFQAEDSSECEDAIRIQTENGELSVLSPKNLSSEFGIEAGMMDAELQHFGVVFKVESISQVESVLLRNGLSSRKIRDRLIVDSEQEQGAMFAFVEK